jgi:hypothetical protein
LIKIVEQASAQPEASVPQASVVAALKNFNWKQHNGLRKL